MPEKVSGRHAVIFEEDDVIRLLKAAVECEGSQTAFARRHGLERTQINAILSGRRSVTVIRYKRSWASENAHQKITAGRRASSSSTGQGGGKRRGAWPLLGWIKEAPTTCVGIAGAPFVLRPADRSG